MHDVFVTYLTNPGDVNAVEPYLVGAICNACRHYWRRTDAASTLFVDEAPRTLADVQDIAEEVARKRLLTQVLARTGSRCREILYRYYIQGETTRAIADQMGYKPTSILIYLSQCRKRALLAYRKLTELE